MPAGIGLALGSITMSSRLRFTFAFAPLLLAATACGGKTAGLTTSPPANCQENIDTTNPSQPAHYQGCSDGGPPVTTVDAATDVSIGPNGTCVQVDPTHFDTTCSVDSDCALVLTGDVCATDCQCIGDTPINTASLSEYNQEISGITLENCHCAERTTPRCLENQCTTCNLGPDGVTCGDAGVIGVSDGGIIFPGEAGIEDAGAADAGGRCVDVNLADYSTTCSVSNDCFIIQTGQVCDGNCECGGSPVSTSGEAMYESVVSGIQFGECGCPAGPPPVCTNGQCVLEGLGG
jgi:hypothetical protein